LLSRLHADWNCEGHFCFIALWSGQAAMRFGLIAGAGGKGLAELGPVYPRSLLAGAVMEHVAACSAPARAEALVKTQGAQLACLCNWLRPSDLTPAQWREPEGLVLAWAPIVVR
jgi:hypothetical protein